MSAYATCITVYEPNRLMSTGFVPSSVSRCAHPATLGSEVEAFLSWLANERKVSVSTHRQALAALLFFYGKVLHGSALASGDRKTSAVAALAGGADPDEVVRILGFLEGEHRLFAQLLYGTGMRISEGLVTAGQGSGFRSRHDHRAGGQGLQGSGLMLPESLAPSLREQLSRTGMVAEGPGRGPQRRCASRRP